MKLSQAEADYLLAMDKRRVDDAVYVFPVRGEGIRLPLKALYEDEDFMLDVSRGRSKELRVKLQTRARSKIPLARLDLGGRPHRNDDNKMVSPPHLHVYREGYRDKWAIVPQPDMFTDLQDLQTTLNDFMQYCNIVRPPRIRIQKG